MHILVRQKSGQALSPDVVGKDVFVRAIVAALVMLETEMLDAFTQGDQPVVMAEMLGAEQCASFIYETPVTGREIVGRHRGCFTVCSDIESVSKWTRARQIDLAQNRADENR